MATAKKKKNLPSHLTDFEKLAGIILLLIYLIVLPFFGGAITDWIGTLLGISITRAASNVICFYILFCAAVLIFHSFLYQTGQTFVRGMERCFKTLGLALVLYYGLNEIFYRLTNLLWNNLTNLNDTALTTQLTAAPRMMAIVVIFLAPFLEELLFRGLIFGWLREHSRVVAYVASCVLFALLHVWQYALVNQDISYLLLMAQYIVPGFIFTWAYDHSGSLWTSIGTHAAVNALAVWTILR